MGGSSVVPSKPFSLPRAEHVAIDAKMGSRGAVAGGVVLATLGVFAGLAAAGLATCGIVCDGHDFTDGNARSTVWTGAAVSAIAAAALMVGGILWINGSGTTDVDVRAASGMPRARRL